MEGRVFLTDRQALRVLCAIEAYLDEHADTVWPKKDLRALIAAKQKIERARDDILTKRIRAGLGPTKKGAA